MYSGVPIAMQVLLDISTRIEKHIIAINAYTTIITLPTWVFDWFLANSASVLLPINKKTEPDAWILVMGSL